MTKRVLVLRFLVLELGPMIAAIGISAFTARIYPVVFAGAAVAIFTNVTLSIRDGAVLESWGYVCERSERPGWFWSWIALHGNFGIFFLSSAALVFIRP